MRKTRLACYLAICLTVLPTVSAYAEPAAKTGGQEQTEAAAVIQITTGTQEAQREKKENAEDVSEDVIEPVTVYEDVHISSTADLVALSRSCWLDTWSRDKQVYLDTDLDLSSSEFVSIPTFGGIFDGQGHTISGLKITDTVSYTGLFCYTQESAVIMNLNVMGEITPSGSQAVIGGIVGDNSGSIKNCTFNGIVEGKDYTGGITGCNELTGTITDCKSQGYVTGTHFTGGIAGENIGNISRCTNLSEVNISNEDKGLSLADINLKDYASSIFDFTQNQDQKKTDTQETINSTVDTGGIAGLSIGVIQGCVNQGMIGYEHVGYNVGGIAGRQSGYIYASRNEGIVYGRKDVGGITGQAEPYVIVDFSQDIVAQLSDNINKLHDIISQTLHDAGAESDTVSSRLSVIQSFTDKALDDTAYLADKTVEWVDGVTGTANEAISRADYIMDEAAKKDGALDQTRYAAGNTKNAATELVKVVSDLDIYQYMTSAEKEQYDNYKKNLENATKEHAGYVSDATGAYEDYYLDKIRSTKSPYTDGVSVNEVNLKPVLSGTVDSTWTWSEPLDSSALITRYKPVENWKHYISAAEIVDFPDPTAGAQQEQDNQLKTDTATEMSNNASTVEANATSYADSQYQAAHGSNYTTDISNWVDGMSSIVMAHTGQMSDNTKRDATNAVNYAKSAAGNLESAGNEVKNIVTTVNGKSDLSLPQLGTEYRQKTNSLVSNLQGMSDNMGYLNGEMANSSDVMLADMEAVNDQFNVIMMLYTDAIDGVLDADYSTVFEDSSVDVAAECTDATIADCVNIGTVKGDIDISGIAGTMGIEYDYDLESDVTGIDNAKLNSTYQTKCVLRADTNKGTVESQKSYLGGVCGLQEMGTVLSCESYGDLTSKAGDYVGGIAGQSLSTIQKSYAKCELSGGKYVAGITGSGTNIQDCYAMVQVLEADSFFGAIAGETTEEGKVHNNFFVSDELAGIDRISFSGKAEPISYQAMLDSGLVPDGFYKLTVSFYVEDAKVKSVECQYGAMLAASEYPVIPEKAGYYAGWDKKELSRVIFDEKVSAEYTRYLTCLAGSQVRNNKQSDFLVDGKFKEGDRLTATLLDTKAVKLKGVVEHWEVLFPSDGGLKHQLRYQKPDNLKDDIQIYVKNGEKWKKAELGSMGSYQIFTIDGNKAEIAVVKASNGIGKYIWMIAAAVLLLLVVLLFFHKKRKRKSNSKDKQTQDSLDGLEEIELGEDESEAESES